MFAADSVNVPEPDFVNVPVPVAIGSATATSPVFASTVNAKAPSNAFPDDTSNVNVPASACTSAAAANVTRPVNVLLPLVLRITPFDEIPEPLTVNASATALNPPETDNAAPDDTVVAPSVVPNAVLFEIATTPVEMVVAPV